MQASETMVAQYNSTLPTLTNEEGQELQLTSRGILLTTVRDDDGTDVIVSDGDSVAGGIDRGFIAYGIDGSDVTRALSVNSDGTLNVVLDNTTGTDADKGSDEAGANAGEIVGITGSYRDIVSIPISNGSTFDLEAFDVSCDEQGLFKLVVESTGGTEYIRSRRVPENVGGAQVLFPRPREITATDASTYLKIIGKCLRANRTMDASGGINGSVQS
jgi:hypothetical protein